MTDEERQEIEDVLNCQHFTDEELLYWLLQDSRKMVEEIRCLQKEVVAKTESTND